MMAQPARTVGEHIIDRSTEYDNFIVRLRDYHRQRGTTFDPEPKVANTLIDLLQLFTAVVSAGGYDVVSDEKLAWRKMCYNLGVFSGNDAGSAFALKTVFLKYLAAYEISTVHGKEPPPKDILEDMTAKGGSLLTRTRANFTSGKNRDAQDSPGPNGDESTITVNQPQPDGTPSTARASRGLREAPPQRVIFQPDTAPSRQVRHTTGHAPNNHISNTHSHSHPSSHLSLQQQQAAQANMHIARNATPSAQFNPSGQDKFSQTVYSFEPQTVTPLVLRAVDTPGNNPTEFLRRNRLAQMQRDGTMPVPFVARQAPPRGLVAGMEGPSIYTRCLCALRSGMPAEQAFALSHLVKISFERGDRFRFDAFQGLAEGLIDKALEIGSLFYKVKWSITYDPDSDDNDVGVLDGMEGTPDILERIGQLEPIEHIATLRTADFADKITLITEATLTMRNMVMLHENAMTMADFPPLKDLICILLHLPNMDSTVELKHFAIDIAEQLTPFMAIDSSDPLYMSLLAQLGSTDRGRILTALRAIGRVSLNLADINRIDGLPEEVLQQVSDWLLLNDDDLLDACLDLLYQFTASPSNIDILLQSISAENLVAHLVRLLSHGGRKVVREHILSPEVRIPAVDEVLVLPADLQDRLLAVEEPERCYAWLKCLFEEDNDSSITQIAIWSAYQQGFSARLQQMGRSMITPADFIKNVNHVWTNAGAQILRTQTDRGEVQKFIIKGIRARLRPTSPEGRDYFRCLWAKPSQPLHQKCSAFMADAEKTYNHILYAHLGEHVGPPGSSMADKEQDYQCLWAGCREYLYPTRMRLSQLMAHVKTHLLAVQQKFDGGIGRDRDPVNGDTLTNGVSNGVGGKRYTHSAPPKRAFITPAKTMSITYEETLVARSDMRPNAPAEAAGIPLSAVLILRNIARNIPKSDAGREWTQKHESSSSGGGDEDGYGNDDADSLRIHGWIARLFLAQIPRLYEVYMQNRVLAYYVESLLQLIRGS